MAKEEKTGLRKVWDDAVMWRRINFPDMDTIRTLEERGWKRHTDTLVALGVYPHLTPVEYFSTPDGEKAFPGTPEYALYKDAVRRIIVEQDARKAAKPSP